MEKGRQGFASIDPKLQRAIASKGGKRAHELGTAYKFNSRTAALAGKIGGKAASRNREHMREIGRKGGLSPKIKK